MGSAWEFDDMVERLRIGLGELMGEVGDNSCMRGIKEVLLTIIDDGCGLVVGMVRMVSPRMVRMVSPMLINNGDGGIVREVRMVIGLVEEGVVIG